MTALDVLPVDLDRTALKAGSVGYWVGLLVPAVLGAVAGVAGGAGGVPGAASGVGAGVFVFGALTAGAVAGAALVRPSLPGEVDWHRRGRAVANGAVVGALWDVVAVFALAVPASQVAVGDAGAADPVAAGARAALTLGLPKGVVLGATGAVVGLLLGPPVLEED